MGPLERIDVKKNIDTTPVPGVKVSANQRTVFGHMTIDINDICIVCFIEIHKDNDTKFSGYYP